MALGLNYEGKSLERVSQSIPSYLKLMWVSMAIMQIWNNSWKDKSTTREWVVTQSQNYWNWRERSTSHFHLSLYYERFSHDICIFKGTKPFLMDDKATETDCAIFGMLSKLFWISSASPFEQWLQDILLDRRCLVISLNILYKADL